MIPAPYQVRGKLQRESRLPPAQRENTGFRVKPGMKIKVKGLLTQYTGMGQNSCNKKRKRNPK